MPASEASLPGKAVAADRYGEGIKWIVSLATGTLALGLKPFESGSITALEAVLFAAAGLMLFGSVLAGAMSALHLVAYASYDEEHTRLSATPPLDAAAVGDAKRRMAKGKRLGTGFFYGSLTTFILGLFSFAALTVSDGLDRMGNEPAPVALLEAGEDSEGRKLFVRSDGSEVLRLVEQGGAFLLQTLPVVRQGIGSSLTNPGSDGGPSR